jgi:hypothetical protein
VVGSSNPLGAGQPIPAPKPSVKTASGRREGRSTAT